MTWHRVDLLDRAEEQQLVATVRPSHLLHLAWYVAPTASINALANLDWVRASLDLYQDFLEQGGERAVGCGSSLEYDWRYGYCSEQLTPRLPNTSYGVCKNALGELVGSYARATGLSFAWPRVFFVYGPREHPDRLVPSAVRSLLAAEPAKCSHGEQIRDYLHVQDVADALVEILDSDVQGAINVGSGVPIKLKEIVNAVALKLGRPDLIALGAIPARANDAPLVVADPSQLRDQLGWRPSIDLDSGLDQTIRWWRDEGMTA